MLKYGILGLLNYHDFTGYEIMVIFHDSLSYFWTAQTSQIYRELQILKNQGWVDVNSVIQVGKPNKNVFSINERGKAEFMNWLASEISTPVRLPLLMQVFFLGERSPEENILFFEKMQSDFIQKIEVLTVAQKTSPDYEVLLDDSYRPLYWEMTNMYGIMHMKMVISWCKSCIEMLKQQK